MLRIGIVIDKWKLVIFDRHLTEKGYKHEKLEGPIDDTWLLRVTTQDVAGLHETVKTAQAECKAA